MAGPNPKPRKSRRRAPSRGFAFRCVPAQTLDIHHLKLHRLAGSLPSLEVLCLGNPVRNHVDPDLLQAFVDSIDIQGERMHVTGRIEFRSHLSLGAERQETHALLHRRPCLGIGHRDKLVGPRIETDEQIKLICILRHRVTAEPENRVSDFFPWKWQTSTGSKVIPASAMCCMTTSEKTISANGAPPFNCSLTSACVSRRKSSNSTLMRHQTFQ